MRPFLTILITAVLATPAFAQSTGTAATEIIGMDDANKPAAATPAYSGTVNKPLSTVAGVTPSTASGTAAAGSVDEIGYDANVKRDPNGNVIDDKTGAAAAPKTQLQRNDRKLSGDSAMFNHDNGQNTPRPPATAPPPTMIIAPGAAPALIVPGSPAGTPMNNQTVYH